VALDEVSRLDEHAARAAGGVVDLAVVGLDDLDDQLDDRGRCEELAALLALGGGELAEEVLVDQPESVALDCLGQPAKQAKELGQDVVRQGRVGTR